jgi:anti-anti-sigma factor
VNTAELVEVERIERGRVLRVRLAGEVDLSNAPSLEAKIIGLMPNEAVGMVLDLRRVSYLDSSGIRMLLTLVGRFSWRGQRLVIVAPPGSRVRKVLLLAGADNALVLDAAEEEAIMSVLHPDPGTTT